MKTKEILGLDIGSFSIKAVQLKLQKKYRLINCSYTEFPVDLNSLSPEEKKEEIIHILHNLLTSQHFSTNRVSISIGGPSLIIRNLQLPKMNPAEFASAIQYEIQPHIPFDLKDVYFTTAIIDEFNKEGVPYLDILAVAARKEAVDEKIEIVEKAGLKPVIVDVDIFALQNSFEISGYEDTPVILCNIGARMTNFVVVKNGKPLIVKDIFIGGDNFTSAIQNAKQMEYEIAEKEKREKGLDDSEIFSSIRQVLESFVLQIRQSIDYYLEKESSSEEIKKIFLSGGSALLKGLDSYLEEKLTIPVEKFNPFFNIDTNSIKKKLEIDPCLFAVATGLAFRREGDTKW